MYAKFSAMKAAFSTGFNKTAAETFEKCTNEQKIYSRGSRPPRNASTDDWLQQTFAEPHPVSLVLAPIYQLNLNKTIQTNLKLALKSYCNRLLFLGKLESCEKLEPDPPLPQPRHWTQWSHDKPYWRPGETETYVQECPDGEYIKSIRFHYTIDWRIYDPIKHYPILNQIEIKCSGDKSSPQAGNWDHPMDCFKGFRKFTARFFGNDALINVQSFCTDSETQKTSNKHMDGRYDKPMECYQGQKVVGIQAKEWIDSSLNNEPGYTNLRIECA